MEMLKKHMSLPQQLNTTTSKKPYLLLEDQIGTLTRKERGVILSEEPVPILRGSILYETVQETDQRAQFVLEEQENVTLNCDVARVAKLNEEQLDYLQAIPVLLDRWRVFTNREWLAEAVVIAVGSVVLVTLQDYQERLAGIVRHKGGVSDWKGIWFGIELSAEHRGKGTTDGLFRRKRYFQCEKDTGVFVAINRVRLCFDNSLFRPSYVSESGIYKPPPVYKTEKAPLDVGERVVWLSDKGPEYGTVRWVGYLPESNNKNLTVGVELDNPVGSGTGKYKHHQLFFTKRNHAALIPIIGLIRASQYGNDPLDDGQHNIEEETSEKMTISEKLHHSSHTFSHHDHHKVKESARRTLSDGKVGTSYGKRSDWLKPVSVPTEKLNTDLDIGSMAEVYYDGDLRYGVVRWMGYLNDSVKPMAGLEMEEDVAEGTDGRYMGVRFFHCTHRRAIFINLSKCNRDRRFDTAYSQTSVAHRDQMTSLDQRSRPDPQPLDPESIPTDLYLGSDVVINLGSVTHGVLRWIGHCGNRAVPIAGIELDTENPAGSDGIYLGKRLFICAPKRAIFVPLTTCRKDTSPPDRTRVNGNASVLDTIKKMDLVDTLTAARHLIIQELSVETILPYLEEEGVVNERQHLSMESHYHPAQRTESILRIVEEGDIKVKGKFFNILKYHQIDLFEKLLSLVEESQ